MVSAIAGRAGAAVDLLGVKLPGVPARIPEIHIAHAQELLARDTGADPRGEPDLAPAHERWLSDWALREHGSEFLYVTGYPLVKPPVYPPPAPGRPGYHQRPG